MKPEKVGVGFEILWMTVEHVFISKIIVYISGLLQSLVQLVSKTEAA